MRSGSPAISARNRRLRVLFGWFSAALIQTAAAIFAQDVPDKEIIKRLLEEADAKDSKPGMLALAVGERGMATALSCAELLDEKAPARAQALLTAITSAATCRRSHPEVLRLVHPAAFEIFYNSDQRAFGKCLPWKQWPPNLPDALIRSAPLPTLEWLQAQAKQTKPQLEKLRLLWPALGWWLRAHHERQFNIEWHEAIAALTLNKNLTADSLTRNALLQLIADAGSPGSLSFVLENLPSPDEKTRECAVNALGRILSPHARCCTPLQTLETLKARALPAFLERTVQESTPSVLGSIAVTAESWPDNPQVGESMHRLFERAALGETRRAVLYAVAKTHWPQRSAILQASFDAPQDGVLAVALQAVVAHPLPEFRPHILVLLKAATEPSPYLIDAAGALADPAASPKLLEWLKKERNLALRLKLALALEKIPGAESEAALGELIANETDPLLVEHLCRIASRRPLSSALTTLISLAEDPTAPEAIRGQAIWALGRYIAPSAQACLSRLKLSASSLVNTDPLSTNLSLAFFRSNTAGADRDLSLHFDKGTPAQKLTCLLALTELKRDHPVISESLESPDFAVLLGGVRAAAAADPRKYYPKLAALRSAPFVSSLLNSGLDSWGLPAALDAALENGAAQPNPKTTLLTP